MAAEGGVRPVTVRLVPMTVKRAMAHVAEVHRHLPKVNGGRFAVGVEDRGELVGVGLVGNGPRVWEGSGKMVITRVAVRTSVSRDGRRDGWDEPWAASIYSAPYCSMIYGALCRAGKALGYTEAWTYTFHWENGASLKASGFTDMGLTDGGEWDRPSRRRDAAVCAEPKRRWMRQLVPPAAEFHREAA